MLDAVAEITNMIIGSVKTDLEAELGPLGLSIPTVVFGRNFKTRSAGTTEWIHVRFLWDEDPLLIKMCLAPSEKPHAVTSWESNLRARNLTTIPWSDLCQPR